jgi:hypothetical protein
MRLRSQAGKRSMSVGALLFAQIIILSNGTDTGFGFWILDFGFWILDFGFWILEDSQKDGTHGEAVRPIFLGLDCSSSRSRGRTHRGEDADALG